MTNDKHTDMILIYMVLYTQFSKILYRKDIKNMRKNSRKYLIYGIAAMLLGLVSPFLLDGDITLSAFIIPVGICLIYEEIRQINIARALARYRKEIKLIERQFHVRFIGHTKNDAEKFIRKYRRQKLSQKEYSPVIMHNVG